MNKRRIIDQGIIFLCVTIIFCGVVWILINKPIVVMFCSQAFILFILSGLIYDSHKDRLPWRRHDGEHPE